MRWPYRSRTQAWMACSTTVASIRSLAADGESTLAKRTGSSVRAAALSSAGWRENSPGIGVPRTDRP